MDEPFDGPADPFGNGSRDALEERLYENLTAFMDEWVVPIMDRAPAFGGTRQSVADRFATMLRTFADGLEGPWHDPIAPPPERT